MVQFAEVLMSHRKALAQLLTLEQGKPLKVAQDEVLAAAHWCSEYAKMELPVQTLADTPRSFVQVRHVALGVVGAIVPWNFPLVLAFFKIAPALAAGNTMVIKPSPFTPLTTLKIGELLRDVMPPGVLNVISGGDALGLWMTEHSGIAKITFTGSTQTGRRIMSAAGATLKRLTLELGGNDAAIVMPDVDVETGAPCRTMRSSA